MMPMTEAEKAQKRAYYRANHGRIRAQQNAARAANREASREYQRRWRSKNRALCLLHDIKKRCARDDLKFGLSLKWIEEKFAQGTCDLSGIRFDMAAKRGDNTPSVDRIDPRGPYTEANCRMIIWFLNRALSDRGEAYALDVFRKVLARQP